MLRFLASFVLVTACAPLAPSARSVARAPRTERVNVTHEKNGVASGAHAARLRPPFGASAGVRRVSPDTDAVPTVVAAVER